MTTTGTPTDRRYGRSRRGRHRRPRPRGAMVAAGGLALAAGTLSLVRLLAEPGGDGVHGFGAEAGPRVETDRAGGTAADRTSPAASTATPPRVSPSATSAMGGLGAFPAPGLIPGPAGGTPSAAHPSGTATTDAAGPSGSSGTAGSPDVPGSSGSSGSSGSPGTPEAGPPAQAPPPRSSPPPRPGAPAPRPAPDPPGRGTPPAPAPAPGRDHPDGLCVPVIGLCVDLLGGNR
ncbi:hypothetical protein ACFQ9U_25685 [Streptomyces sp. NPDC056568]|uniref:hypothetical protein n=1 Tax=Streptomyces sp. NPDC056568 TaxID=3345866 RepID=UPI0036B9BAAA